MKNIDKENITAQLTGALIGLARATEGNSNRPTLITHKAMLSGMRMALPGTEVSKQKINEGIHILHREKEKLVPRCSDCESPCGRNNDYIVCEINEQESNLAVLKHTLLSGLLSLEPLLRNHPENEPFEQAMDFIYKGFFIVGYDCGIESISPLLYELEQIRQSLTDSFLRETAANSGEGGLIKLSKSSDLIQYFVNVIEAKDLYTQGHSHHVSVIVNAVFDSLPASYRRKLDKEKLLTAALLHDIGKISTPDPVLNKDGALDDEEWRVMREHPANGKKIIENTSFSEMGDWILYHHERIDGRGYCGLKNEEIPLESRIIAIADTFSALRTYRIYRPAKSIAETIRIMRECAGTQLDAEILDHFLSIGAATLETLECNCEICKQRRKALEARISGD